MIVKLIKFLKGSVKIKVSGFSPERFINLCGNKNILIWDIENYGDYYILWMNISGFFKLKSIVKKTKTKVVILEKKGLPFFIPKMKKRKFFIIGFIVSICMLILMSNFIWEIEVSGNEQLTKEAFMHFLETQNVFYGMKKNDLDIEALEKAIRNEYHHVTWTSAKLKGTKLYISIKENTILREEIKEQTPCNIVANVSGEIVSMVTREGIPLANAGTQIQKGDVLIEGSVAIKNDDESIREYLYYASDADIYIRYQKAYTDTLQKKYEQKEYTGYIKNNYFISFFGKSCVFGKKPGDNILYDSLKDEKQIKILEDFYLPIFYGKLEHKEYTNMSKIYTSAQMKSILSERFQSFCATLEEKGVEILEKNVTIDSVHNGMKASGTLTVIEQGGEKVPIPVIQPEQTEMKEADEN